MKTDANWCVRSLLLVLTLTLAFAALSCGGGGGNVQLDPTQNPGSNTSTSIDKGVGLVISEDEIGSLPAWQQEMLSDPGWNQPYIAPRASTPIEPPTHELLIAETQKALEQGLELAPRVESGSKGVSWDDQGNYQPPTAVAKGEYESLAPNGDPQYGCNDYDGNSSDGHAIEDVISDATMVVPQRISYVEQGISAPNHFNKNGGSGNDAQSAVYQLFATDREADPLDPESTAEFAELSYRADLAPGVAPGGDCSAATAFAVTGQFWKRFNSKTNVLPGLTETAMYNILIAPSSEQTAELVSSGDTSATYQTFYFGALSACYGGGWIVGLTSSESDCDDFNQFVADAQNTGFYVRPVYGILLKRWQDLQLSGMAGPWESELGWPVFGPVAFQNGTPVLTVSGAYYAWGMWFEKGFIWWIDYDQDLYPNTPDEAQTYSYSGANVYCAENATYSKLGATIFYGGEGPLAVNVSVDAFRPTAGDPWTPAPLDDTGTFYQIGLPDNDGLATISVAMHAQGYGGVPNEDCVYKHYVWAFRNGQISAAGAAYSDSNKYVTTAYGSSVRNEEGVYVVRVQVTDSEDTVAYGDSLPIHIGHGSPGGGGGEVMLIRNDGNAYPTGYDALKADLETLGAAFAERPFSATLASDFHDEGFKVAIWYRGGPQATGETVPYTTAWTAQEIDNYLEIMNDGHQVLLVSQSHGYQNSTTPLPYGWQVYYGCTNRPASVPGGQERHPWAASLALELGIGLFGGDYFPSAPTNLTGLIQNGMFGPDSAAATGERYDGAGSSTKLPITFELSTSGTQYCGIGYWSPWMGGWASGPYFRGGMAASPAFLGYNLGYLSWGNLQAPDSNIGFFPNYSHTSGPGKLWIIGYPYSQLKVLSAAGGASMTRDEVLKNMLGWLNSGLTWGAGPTVAYDEYAGPPEILQVMPGWWEAGAFNTGAAAQTWTGTMGNYPDQTGSNVYRTTPPGSGNYVLTTTPNNDWVNGNDVDFQFPWYAYITDVDGDGVEIGEGNLDDDIVTFGGLLLEDPDANWSRDITLGYYDNPNADPVPSCVIDGFLPAVVVAGYFVSTTTGDTGDEIRASYGTEAPSMYWDNQSEMVVETIAHWPAGLTTGQVYWSMYPGQSMFDPYNYPNLIPDQSNWDAFRTIDVDPSVMLLARDAPGNAAQIQWNRSAYLFSDATSAGRTVTFDYRTANNWNGDLNRDGARDLADKFPIRCRLFTDLADMTAWSGIWPNHMYNPGSEPGPSWPTDPPAGDDGDFVEGGCYVVDTGQPVYPLTIMDNPMMPDPGNPLAYNWNDYQDYTVNLYFRIHGGLLDYTSVKFDYDYQVADGWDDASPTVVDVAVTPATMDHWGYYEGTVNIQPPSDPWEGHYMALWVEDSTGATDVYWYPTPQNLHGVINAAVLSDPLSQAPIDPGKTYKRNVQKMVDDLTLLYGATQVTVIDLSAALVPNQLDGYNLIVWPVDRVLNNESVAPYGFTDGAGNANIVEVARAHTEKGASVLIMGNNAWRKIVSSSPSIPQWDTISPLAPTYSSASYGTSSNGSDLLPSTDIIPNSLPGISLRGRVGNKISTTIIGTMFQYSPQLRSAADPTNYPSANCKMFMRGYYNAPTNSYGQGAYARKATGRRGNLITVVTNYGDLSDFQPYTGPDGSKHRAAVLENILCCGKTNSMFDAQGVVFPTPPPPAGWAHTIGYRASQTEYGYGIDTDSSNNIYTVGQWMHTVSTSSYTDVVISKWNAAGTLQWVRAYNKIGYSVPYDYGQKIYVDSPRNCMYVVGMGYGYNPSYLSYYRPFVLKIDLNGNLLWARWLQHSSYTTTSSYYAYYTDIAVDTTGNPIFNFYVSSTSTQHFLTKLDVNGNMLWARSYGTSGSNTVYTSARALVTDGSGNIFWLNYGYNSSMYGEPIITKFNSSGTFQWDRAFGNQTYYDYPIGIAVDGSGDVYGAAYGLRSSIGWNDTDWFIVKLNGATGASLWGRRYGDTGLYENRASYGNGLHLTPTGRLGFLNTTSTSGPVGLYDVGWFTANLSDGSIVNSGAFGTSNYDYTYDQEWSTEDRPLVSGYATSNAGWDFRAKTWANSTFTPTLTTWNGAVTTVTVTSNAVASYDYVTVSSGYTLDTGAGSNDHLLAKASTLTP